MSDVKINKLFVARICYGFLIFLILFTLLACTCKKSEIIFKEVSYREVLDKIKANDSFYIMFTRKDCEYCEKYIPKLKKIAEDNKINIINIVDTSTMSLTEKKDCKDRFSNKFVPAIYYVKKSNVLDGIVGDVNEKELTDWMKKITEGNGK